VATAEEVRSRAGEVAGEAAASVGARAQAAGEAIDLERVAGLWPSVLDHVVQSGAGLLAAAIGDARPVAVDSDRSVVELGFPSSAAFNRRTAEVKENRDRVVEALRSVLGTTLRPVYVTLDSRPEPAADGEAPEIPGEDDLLERFVSEFDAEVLMDDEPRSETG
jgi:hypothetical protein